jgi:PAS domain S-box-containing protein
LEIDKDMNLSVAELRRRAEERLHDQEPDSVTPRTEAELQRLVHELQIHQIELEMQNAELRQSRAELETALEKYADLYDFAPVGYFSLDRNGVIGAVNLSGATLLGVERSRLIGHRFGGFVPGNDRLSFNDFLWKVFASQVKESCEITLTTAGNLSIFVQIEAIAHSSGENCRIAVIDITRRRSVEDALSLTRQDLVNLNSSLELRITEALAELRRKDEMMILQDRLAVMGEMINNIAHQWRQPLNTLGLLIQKLPLFYDSVDFNRNFLEENSANAMKLIQHMSRTIEDFRNFFRSDKEKVTFNVSQVIENTISLVNKSFKEQQITIDFQTQGDPVIYGYPNEFAQVILNILMNSRDALAGHNLEDAAICINSFTEKSKTVVTITDRAGGIDSEIIDRLFEPYFSTKGPEQGTGIGLYMSKTIIETNMGGSLTVCNTGDGAEFRIEVNNAEY